MSIPPTLDHMAKLYLAMTDNIPEEEMDANTVEAREASIEMIKEVEDADTK